MQYDEYQVNRAENRLVKTTLLKLQKSTRSGENAKEIRQLLVSFELVDVSTNIDKDFASVSIGRDTKDYERLIQWSEVFLRNKSFTTFSGKKSGKGPIGGDGSVIDREVSISQSENRPLIDSGSLTIMYTSQGF